MPIARVEGSVVAGELRSTADSDNSISGPALPLLAYRIKVHLHDLQADSTLDSHQRPRPCQVTLHSYYLLADLLATAKVELVVSLEAIQ